MLVTCLIGVHICHLRLKKKLRWIKEIAERKVGVHENEAYGSFQRQHTNVNVNRRRDTLEETLNTPSPEHIYDTADMIRSTVTQIITIENQSEEDKYQYIDIDRLEMLDDRRGLSRGVQRTHARTQAEHHDQLEPVYENVLL